MRFAISDGGSIFCLNNASAEIAYCRYKHAK